MSEQHAQGADAVVDLNNELKTRREKLANLREQGIAFPNDFRRDRSPVRRIRRQRERRTGSAEHRRSPWPHDDPVGTLRGRPGTLAPFSRTPPVTISRKAL